MSPDREWGKIFYCHTCRQYQDDEAMMKGHQLLGHQANSFISMPRNVEKRMEPKEDPKPDKRPAYSYPPMSDALEKEIDAKIGVFGFARIEEETVKMDLDLADVIEEEPEEEEL